MFNRWLPFQFRLCRSLNQPAPTLRSARRKALAGLISLLLIQVTPTLGTHAGINAVGVALVTGS